MRPAEGTGVGVGETVGLGVGLGVAVGEGDGRLGAGVTEGAGVVEMVSTTTGVAAPTLVPVGTLRAKTASTGIAFGPDPFSAT